MNALLTLSLLALMLCVASAKRGSISNNLFDDDVNDDGVSEEDTAETNLKAELRRNPCFRKKCYRGEICELDKNREAVCVCRSDCSFYSRGDDRFQVCSNKNKTYSSECELDSDHCRCKRGETPCSKPGTRKIQLAYYGACQEMQECPEKEGKQFPLRMRNWLFVIMETLAQRAKMGEYQELVREAESDPSHSSAVIWKFCDLDTDPQDRRVSRRELQKTVRSLRAMERCLVPFLDECDANDDREITLIEWGTCLNVDRDHITDRCHEIHKHAKNK